MADPLKPRWYAVSVFSGAEDKVVDELKEKAEKAGLSDMFVEILVPKEDVVEVKRGVKKTVSKSFFPGYILIKMYLTDEVWHLIHQIPRISSFAGRGKPIPLAEKEIDRIRDQMKESAEKPKDLIVFDVGEQVLVEDGPFAALMGQVEEVDFEKSRLKVSVSIFGRSTPVDLEFSQVKKV
jgi:transcriptional antiterminator NusG